MNKKMMKATALNGKHMSTSSDEMNDMQRTTGMTRTGTFLMTGLCLAMLTLVSVLTLISPDTAQAKIAQTSVDTCSTSSCHPRNAAIDAPLPQIQAAVQNVTQSGPSTLYSGAIAATAGDTLEIDWKFTELDYVDLTSPLIWLPSGWTPTAGTLNSPPITLGNNWSTAWDSSTGESWFGPRATDEANAPDGWMIDYTNSAPWGADGSGVAFNDGSGNDDDGWAGEMGCDTRITIPGGTPTGTYYIWVLGSGKGKEIGKTKALKASVGMMLTINVTAGANANPNSPTNLAQYRNNGTTLIASGGYTNETTVVIEADISDPDGSNTVKLQVDLDSNGSSDCESLLLSNPSNNVQVSCSVSNGNAYNWQVRAVDNQGATSSWTPYPNSGTDFIVDTTAPSLNPVTIASNNADNSRAKVGDTVTLNFTSSETVTTPTVTISGQSASVSGGPTNWTATRVMASGDPEGTVAFTINYTDLAGNSGPQVSSTTNGSSVTFDKTAPAVSLPTSPANGATGVPVDSNVTINFTENVNCSTVNTSSIISDSPGWTLSNCSGSQTVFTTSGQAFNTSYNVDVTSAVTDLAGNPSAAYSFSYDTAGAPNTAPNAPADHDQYKNDGTTLIPQGGTTDETIVKIIATVSDADANDVQLQVEIIDNGSAYTGTPNFTSGFVTSGSPATVSCTSLLDTVSYKWRVRTYDGVDFSSWTEFGGADPDVTISLPVNAAPDAPVDHDQYKIDAVTLIPQGGTTNETTVKIKATVFDLDANDVELQVEIIDNASSYTGTPNFTSGFVASGNVATVTCTPLTDTASYKWRVRTFDGIDYSAWTVYGGSDPDVTIDTSSATNVITNCGGCHDYPPADGPRDGLTGAVVGDHAVHGAYTCDYCHVTPGTETAVDFAHRDGNIQLKNGTIGDAAAGDNGSYSKGATFAQSNTPTTGTCSNVNCHNNTVTPQWGVGTTTCTSCHTEMPPATNAHATHYTAKGWTSPDNLGSECSTCHPVDHNGSVDVNGSLGFVGNSCSTTSTGCHNGNTTPTWNTTNITCTDCHTVDGPNTATAANPVSGLHGNSVASVQDHDDSLPGGCEACHVKASISGHWDGTASATADYDKFTVGVTTAMYQDATGTAATRGSCLSNTQLAACHTDGGEWRRLWSTDADVDIVASPLPGQAVCNVCHGQYSSLTASTGWNEGTVHYRSGDGTLEDKGLFHTDSGDECEDCHGYDSAATHNSNNAIDFSDGGGTYTVTQNSNRWYCATCHNSHLSEDPTGTSTHTFADSLGFPDSVAHVTGDSVPEGDCFGCHGDGIAEYWPQNPGNDRDLNTDASYNNDGRHDRHMNFLATRLGYTLPGTDTQQREMCTYCHAVEDVDHMTKGVGEDAEVFPASAKSLWGGNDVDASYSEPNDTCSNIDCHNSQTTVDGTYGWYDAGTSTCTMCHTPGGANVDPNSGLHTGATPTISGQKHDDTIAGGCTACHTTLPANSTSSTHINGTASINGSIAGDRTNMGLFGTFQTSGSDNIGTCATNCHSGAGDNGTWDRRWDSSIHYDPIDADFDECAGCHGGFAGDWTFGTDNVVGDGSVSHDRNWDGDGTSGEVIGSHPDNTDKCKSCHGFGYTGVYDTATFAAHRDGKITFNDEMGYNPSTYTCATYCHADNTNHNLEDSGWSTTANTVNGPPLACTDCHAGAQASAGVNVDSPHSTATIFASKGVTYSCEDCHTGHGLGDTQVPNNSAVGINYGTGGIDLSDPIGTATSEAEICWNCHAVHNVSEWGVNTDTNTTSFPNFDFGSLSQTEWNGATWYSANFLYKQGTIQSTHSVNNSSGVSGVDANANIRCSYCHDVHDTNVTTGDSSSGKPFLRGSWAGNPYLEDGAPRNDGNSDDADYSAYDVTDRFGAVPRGDSGYTAKGGYYIDQNSGHPTNNAAMDSPDEFAGLCRLCHEGTAGTPGDGVWQPEEIDSLNKFGTPSNDWVGTNGHGAVIKGGGGSQAANIFTMADRMPSWQAYTDDGTEGGNPVMAYLNARFVDKGSFTNGWGQGMRGKDGTAFEYQPFVDTNTRGYNYQFYDWGATVVVESGTTMTDSGIDASYHQFTCSKCHNPHASRLPRLMITNCLDTNHNTWDDTLVTPSSDTNGSSSSLSAVNRNAEYSQMTSAQNCHRLNDPNDTDSMGSGWNTVTPWQEF